MADFHILDDLGQRERGGTGNPRATLRPECQQQSAGHLEAALGGDGAMDVARVTIPE